MVVGASIPSVSVLAVSARSAAFGFAHGVLTSLGIVVGDLIFILTAIYGLSVLAGLLGSQFVLIKYLGAAYLIGLGVLLWRSKAKAEAVATKRESSLLASFLTGLLITLGDQKAILFYLGFLPAFVDLSTLSFLDAGIIVGSAAIAVGGPKLAYAFLAGRAMSILESPRITTALNIVAGGVLVGVGVVLMAQA